MSKEKIVAAAAQAALRAKANSPKLMFAAGVVGAVSATVLACKSTLKLPETLASYEDELMSADIQSEAEETPKSVVNVHLRYTYEIGKLYAPAILIGGVSIALLTGSHVVLSKRNASLSAAYAGLDKAYRAYRERVRAEVGEEKELEIHRGVTIEEVTDADGKKHKIASVTADTVSPYARWFNEACANWSGDAEVNRLYLTAQERFANDLLKARGHVFLNEVYTALDIPHSQEGALVGWFWDPEDETRDNHIDFGMFEVRNSEFLNGTEKSILLDFNVDGEIYRLIG